MRHDLIAWLAFVLSLQFGVATTWLHAAITFDPENQALRVTDCLKTAPCTPRALWQMDRMNGWGKVAYDRAHGTYTIDADLWIGSNDGTETKTVKVAVICGQTAYKVFLPVMVKQTVRR